MNFNFLITIILLATGVKGQHHEGVVQIHILDTVLVTNVHDLRISIKMKLTNKTDSTFLLYGINSFEASPVNFEKLFSCETKMSAAMALFIYDASFKMMGSSPRARKEIHHKPVPKEKLDSMLLISKAKYLNGTKVIKGFEVIEMEKEIDLKQYELQKGIYYIQLVYFSGNLTSGRVNPEQIAKDKLAYEASVYRGFSVSNKIMFSVE